MRRATLLAAAVAATLAATDLPGAARDLNPEWLALIDCPGEPGCPAIVLLDDRELLYEDYRVRYKARVVRKLLTTHGVAEFGNAELPPTERGRWRLRAFSGRTVAPDGGIIPLSSRNEFEKELRLGKRKVKVRSAAFEGVVPGAIVEYSFEYESPPGALVPGEVWELQQPIPVLEGRFRVKRGLVGLSWARTGIDRPEFEQGPEGSKYEFRARNIPSIPREPFSPSPEALKTRFYFFLDFLQSTWEGALAGRWARRAGKMIDARDPVGAKLQDLVLPEDSQMAKLEKAYRFVQERVLPEGDARLEIAEAEESDDVARILERGSGNELERTVLFLALAREAGMDVGLALISSRHQGVLNDLAPLDRQYDSFAAAIRNEGRWSLFDPATRHCPLGMVSPEKEGAQVNAIIVRPDKTRGEEFLRTSGRLAYRTQGAAPFDRVRVPFQPAAMNVLLRRMDMVIGAGPGLEGEVIEEGSGAVDLDHRRTYEALPHNERTRVLDGIVSGFLPGAQVTDPTFVDMESFDRTAAVKYRVSLPDAVVRAGERLIVHPLLFGAWSRNPFTAEKRRTPVYFPHSQTTQDRIQIGVPAEYVVDTLPPPVLIQDPPLTYRSSVTLERGALVVLRLLVIDTAEWPVGEYPRLKAFFEKMQEADKQVVVLRKGGVS